MLVLEGEVQAEAPTDFRLVGVLHLPFAALGSARILIVDEEFVFLESARDLLLHATIDGAHVKNVIGERCGAKVFDRLDTRDMGFASVGLNGDQRPEVFSAIADYTDCGTRGNCGGGITTPLSEDTDGPYPWRWREITPFDTPIRPTMTFSVSPDFVRGWRVLRFGDACWAWLDGRYQVFSHATFRLIPVQGCFE